MNRSIVGLSLLAIGLAGCHHDEPAKPQVATQSNPMGMPASDYNKLNSMSPEMRARLQPQMDQIQRQRQASAGSPDAAQKGQ